MNKTQILLATLTLVGATACIVPDADAQRVRSRTVTSGNGGRAVSATGSGPQGTYTRSRAVNRDGQGNATGSRNASVQGANGGSAGHQGSFYRNADDSAGRQGSASVEGANGGSASTSGSLTRDANGNVNGSRSTTATGTNGNSYDGSTTVTDGQVSHTGTCTNAAGETIDCRGGN